MNRQKLKMLLDAAREIDTRRYLKDWAGADLIKNLVKELGWNVSTDKEKGTFFTLVGYTGDSMVEFMKSDWMFYDAGLAPEEFYSDMNPRWGKSKLTPVEFGLYLEQWK